MEATVIVCARNESENIGKLIADIKNQLTDFEFELMLINDFSTDDTYSLMLQAIENDIRFCIINLADVLDAARANVPNKKRGIELAVAQAKGKYILTTDADCRINQHWLSAMVSKAKTLQAQMVCGPVFINSENSVLALFQKMDAMLMMTVTEWTIKIGLPVLSNGANLLYEKNCFANLNPYSDNIKVHSGDDIFLIQKFKDAKLKVSFCREQQAIVTTKPQKTYRDFFNQRIRWVGKGSAYKNIWVQLFAVLVFIFFALELACLILPFFNPMLWYVPLIVLAVKNILMVNALAPQIKFSGEKGIWKYIPLFELLHTFYIVFFGIFSFKKSYIWRGRKVSQ
jgi:poly-beta-1,6-N-acetyl-D-glucosamine synthase